MEHVVTEHRWLILPAMGIVLAMAVAIASIIGGFRTRQKGLEVLKAYAERGEEPPASVLNVLQPAPPPPGEPIPRFGFFLVLGLGCGFMWAYLAPHPEFGLFALLFFIATIGSAAMAVANLLRALTSRRP